MGGEEKSFADNAVMPPLIRSFVYWPVFMQESEQGGGVESGDGPGVEVFSLAFFFLKEGTCYSA
jgi:hypothetical protein